MHLTPVSVGLGAIIVLTLYALYRRLQTIRRRQHLAALAKAKREQSFDAIAKAANWNQRHYLPPQEDQDRILAMSVAELLQAYRSLELSPVTVMSTYIEGAYRAHQEFNCVSEDCFLEGLEQAVAAEARYRRNPSRVLPLDGIPLSVKDSVSQRGTDATCGLQVRCFDPFEEDGALVGMLRDAGMIPFVRTTAPQALLLPETKNHIFGLTTNPFNKARSPGGSSGGEGCLIASGGSILGIGTDIGGSIRIPAAFCGLYALKPTPQRLTRNGLVAPRPVPSTGQEHVVSVAGPMGRCVDDLLVMMEAWMGADSTMWQRDATVPPMPWNRAVVDGTSRLTVGYYTYDGWGDACPAAVRAVREAAMAMQRAGHTVVPFDPPCVPELCRAFIAILGAVGGAGITAGLQGEAWLSYYAKIQAASFLPNCVRPALAAVLRCLREERAAGVVASTGAKTAQQLWAVLQRKDIMLRQFHAAWRDAGVDVVLCPTTGAPPFRHGASADLSVTLSYTFLYNLLHFPAGVVPVTTVRRDEERKPCDTTLNDQFGKVAAAQSVDAAGLPMSVQVVALPYRDELVMRAMKELEAVLPPRPVPEW